jgi:signal transduction histidine kinase
VILKTMSMKTGHSIRWRLSLSFAAIALLAALALGVVLLAILRGYYSQRELSYLRGNAKAISQALTTMVGSDAPPDMVQSQVENFSFLSQVRVRVLGADGRVRQDSGTPQKVNVALSAAKREVFFRSQVLDKPSAGYVRIIALGDGLAGTGPITETAPGFNGPPPEALEPNVAIAYKAMPVVATLYGFGLDSEVALDGRRSAQVVKQPFYDEANKVLGSVELSEGPSYGSDILDNVARGWAVASAVAIILAAAVGWVISRRISAPVLALTAATTRMAKGDLSTRADVRGQDEFSALAQSFNEMAVRVESTVTALCRFVSDAAHELHTPLTALRTDLELFADEPDAAARLAFAERAQAQIARLERLTGELLDLSRIESGAIRNERVELDLVELVELTSEPYASQAEQAGIDLSLDLPSQAIIVNGNEAQLRCALGNLLDNAIKFTPEGGMVSVSLRHEEQRAKLCVQDTGMGIPADDLLQLFSRFHRGRNAMAYPGSGLGLAIVKAIVESHGGQVMAENTSPGTRFTLQLPIAA